MTNLVARLPSDCGSDKGYCEYCALHFRSIVSGSLFRMDCAAARMPGSSLVAALFKNGSDSSFRPALYKVMARFNCATEDFGSPSSARRYSRMASSVRCWDAATVPRFACAFATCDANDDFHACRAVAGSFDAMKKALANQAKLPPFSKHALQCARLLPAVRARHRVCSAGGERRQGSFGRKKIPAFRRTASRSAVSASVSDGGVASRAVPRSLYAAALSGLRAMASRKVATASCRRPVFA